MRVWCSLAALLTAFTWSADHGQGHGSEERDEKETRENFGGKARPEAREESEPTLISEPAARLRARGGCRSAPASLGLNEGERDYCTSRVSLRERQDLSRDKGQKKERSEDHGVNRTRQYVCAADMRVIKATRTSEPTAYRRHRRCTMTRSWVICVDSNTGKERWRKQMPMRGCSIFGSSPDSSDPTTRRDVIAKPKS